MYTTKKFKEFLEIFSHGVNYPIREICADLEITPAQMGGLIARAEANDIHFDLSASRAIYHRLGAFLAQHSETKEDE